MPLEDLRITEIEWGDRMGQYEARIKFSSEHGSVEAQLSPEHVSKVLNVVADALVNSARDVANNLTAEIITQSNNLLESQK